MELVDATRAAEILGVTKRQIHNLARQGVIRAHYPKGRKLSAPQMFKAEEVAAYAELREKKLGLVEVASIAQQALITCRMLERTVDRMRGLIGMCPLPDFSKDAILEKYNQAQDALQSELPFDVDEVVEWSHFFQNVGEEYFELVEKHTGDGSPWNYFLKLASKMRKEAPEYTDRETQVAYDCLAVASTFMRQSAYFYIRNKYGKRTAAKICPETADDIASPVLAMAFPD